MPVVMWELCGGEYHHLMVLLVVDFIVLPFSRYTLHNPFLMRNEWELLVFN